MKISTHGCGARWVQRGDRTSHCSGCHRTFAGTEVFDRHRVDLDNGRGCLDPADMPNVVPYLDDIGSTVWKRVTGVAELAADGSDGPFGSESPPDAQDAADGRFRQDGEVAA